MFQSVSAVRALSMTLVVVMVVSLASGCSRFRKGEAKTKGDYVLSPEMRPLEVPPELTLPDTSGAMALPPPVTVSRGGGSTQAGGPATSVSGFTVPGGVRDDVFGKVGTVLGRMDDITVVNRAQLLGSYDVSYRGSNFLVRVTTVDAGAHVSVVDPRGLPATGEGPARVMTELRSALNE
ncbi:MAG: hypothetical protein LBV45_02825 [Xanthomonadaceae bacterium]|nr:hypothetical protein [Xanthomonadaceae bacterium]